MDKHLAYGNIVGTSIGDQQFNSTANFIESTFADSPFYRVAKWNGQVLELRLMDVNSITRSNQIMPVQHDIKFALFKPNVVLNLGEIIEINDISWMVVDFTNEDKLFPKAKIEICNFTLPIKTGETKTLLGKDNFGAPVYDIQPIFMNMKAILKNTIGSINLNQSINLPSERMLITITYDDTSKLIKENDTFDVYGREYKVVGIDFSAVCNGVGIITLTTERVVNV